MKRLKVYVRVDSQDKIDCICLRENKGCDRYCEKDTVLYDQYQHIKECMLKNEGVKFHG